MSKTSLKRRIETLESDRKREKQDRPHIAFIKGAWVALNNEPSTIEAVNRALVYVHGGWWVSTPEVKTDVQK